VFGRRRSGWPLSTTRSPRCARSDAQNSSRNPRTGSIERRSPARAHAVPRAAVRMALSVPARRPPSCPAPWISDSKRVPARTYRAAPTGEDDFLGRARQEACHAFTVRFHHPLRWRPGPVRARRIAVTVIHCRAHRFRHARIDGRTCVEIQIDLSHRSENHDFASGEGCRSESMHHATLGTHGFHIHQFFRTPVMME
jgi:hypothetical protein